MTEKDSKDSSKDRPLLPDDDEILGVFGRLKDNITEIKTASSARNSMERSSESSRTADRSSKSGRYSRQNSERSDRHKTSEKTQDGPSKPEKSSRVNGTDRTEHEKVEKKEKSTRHEKEKNNKNSVSTHNIPDDASRVSTHSRASKQSSKRQEKSSHGGEDSHVSNGDGRDSRAMSERSHASSRRLRPGEWSTDQYLEAYHREWQLHWTYQQQQQQKQLGQPATYAFTQAYSQLPTSSSAANLYQVAHPPQPTQPEAQVKPPLPPVFNNSAASTPVRSEQRPSVMNYPAPSTILRPAKEELLKVPAKPQRVEWKGCLLTANESSEISRSGRSTTLLVKTHTSVESEKDRTEMELFPGMMLMDDGELRNKVVDFGRHMSSLSNETAEYGTVELEAVFWDLVVHFVSRGEQSRPYEVAEILMRLVADTGRDSVASVRTGRDKYPEMHLYPIRKALQTGDVESAVKYAESGDCWELALCLQTVQSNLECKNLQANDLAVKALDQKLSRGDPVHTICCLACGRMPNVENCFREWVANLAIVLACSSFVQQEELRLRFIGNLADLLSAANMPMARDICLIFCSSEKRFSTPPFSLIGAEADFEASSKFSLSHFFMTEAFIFLAQILQGINLHTCVDLIKMELVFVEALVDRSLNQQATEYCKNIVLVIKEYGVQLSFDLYAQLFHLSIACAGSNAAVYQEDWLQWLWNIFTSYKEARAGRKRSDSQAVRPRTLSNVSVKPPSVKHHSPVIPPSQSSGFYVEEPHSVFARDDDVESVHSGIHFSSQRRGSHEISMDGQSLARSRQNSTSTRSSVDSRRPSESRPSSTQTSINSHSHPRPSLVGNQLNQPPAHRPVSPTHRSVTPPPQAVAPLPSSNAPPPMYNANHAFPPMSNPVSAQTPITSVAPPPAETRPAVADSTEEQLPPSVPMFFSSATQARPSFMNAFPVPGRIPDSSTPLSPSDPALNTGDAPYFSPSQQNTSDYASEPEDDKENNKPTKMWDPTADFDEPDRGGGGKKSEAKKTKDDKAADATKKAQNPGWFGSIFKKPLSIFKGRKQVHLPDDKKPTLVYDEVKKRWIDTSKSGQEEEEVVAPPPKMSFGPVSNQPINQPSPASFPSNGPTTNQPINQLSPGFNGPSPQSNSLPGGGMQPPLPGQGPPSVNMFRIGAGASPGGYNPYASLMAGMQAPPRPTDMTNHFMPAPTIPEE